MFLDQNRKQLDYHFVVWKFDTQKLDQSTLHKLDVGVANANDDDNEDINSIDSQGNEIDKRPVEFAGKSACCTIF